MKPTTSIAIGVLAERRKIDHPWQDYEWEPVGVWAHAPKIDTVQELRRGEDFVQYHLATEPLELFRKETEAYKVNLDEAQPVIYVILREDEDADDGAPMLVHLVTASPFEAQDYLDSGDEIVARLDMPKDVEAVIRAFVEAHHVEEQFKKRRRDRLVLEDHKFGQEPIFETRKRALKEHDRDK